MKKPAVPLRKDGQMDRRTRAYRKWSAIDGWEKYDAEINQKRTIIAGGEVSKEEWRRWMTQKAVNPWKDQAGIRY